MASQPAPYKQTQLIQYLKRIRYFAQGDKGSGEECGHDINVHRQLEQLELSIQQNPLPVLSELQRRHLSTIPFGNSELHYSQHHAISLDPESLFHKMIDRKLDGYCLESTGLFYNMLRCLGFHVYATGARVNDSAVSSLTDQGDRYGGFSHMVLIVKIVDDAYLVDVGFGPQVAPHPLKLEEDKIATVIAPVEMRLLKDSIPDLIDQYQKVWIYQTRYNPDNKWRSAFCFSEVEFLPRDFDMMNFYISKNPTSWFTQKFFCTIMILDETQKTVIGEYILSNNEVKRRVQGQSEVLVKLENEKDRVAALAKWFDMHLSDEEIQGIRGMVSEIP